MLRRYTGAVGFEATLTVLGTVVLTADTIRLSKSPASDPDIVRRAHILPIVYLSFLRLIPQQSSDFISDDILFLPLQIDQLRLICCDCDEICLNTTVIISLSSFFFVKTTTGFEPAIPELQSGPFSLLGTSSFSSGNRSRTGYLCKPAQRVR